MDFLRFLFALFIPKRASFLVPISNNNKLLEEYPVSVNIRGRILSRKGELHLTLLSNSLTERLYKHPNASIMLANVRHFMEKIKGVLDARLEQALMPDAPDAVILQKGDALTIAVKVHLPGIHLLYRNLRNLGLYLKSPVPHVTLYMAGTEKGIGVKDSEQLAQYFVKDVPLSSLFSENTVVRVSAASLAEIKMDGKYLAVLSRSQLKAGRKVFGPFGGALEFHEGSRNTLLDMGATFEKGEDSNDLRFELPTSNLGKFEEWFAARKGRELGVARELREELVDEEGILKEINGGELFVAARLKTARERATTDRPGQVGKVTERFLEIYKVNLRGLSYASIKEALEKPESRIALLTREEIIAGRSDSGIKIGSGCKALL